MKLVVLFLVLFIAGCSTPGPIRLSPDTYMIVREDHGGIFGSAAALKAGVIGDANAFAEAQGKIAIPLASHDKPMGNGPAQWASFEYQFRVVDKNDPEARRTSLVPRADVVVEKTEKVTMDVKSKDETSRPKDIYAELLKLDDLHKRRILTDAEFEAQKAKLLSSN